MYQLYYFKETIEKNKKRRLLYENDECNVWTAYVVRF